MSDERREGTGIPGIPGSQSRVRGSLPLQTGSRGRLFCSSCVECKFFKSGPFEKNCSQACPNIHLPKTNSTEVSKNDRKCREKDSQNCWMSFFMVQEDGKDMYTIIVDPDRGTHPCSSCPATGRLPTLPQQPGCFAICLSQNLSFILKIFLFLPECPEPPNVPLIVGSTIAGVFLIGVLILVIWRLLMELLDRREYRRFEKEKTKAKWNDVREHIRATRVFWGAQIHWGGDSRRGHPFQRQPCRPEPSPLLIFQPSWILPKYPMESSCNAACAVGTGMGGMGNALLEIQHSPTQASPLLSLQADNPLFKSATTTVVNPRFNE